jgi:hypothetical protein
MTDLAIPASRAPWPWLRSPAFDLTFVVGLLAVAAATALVVIAYPALFLPVLAFDLWFLGYHHVISTYTRLCFDRRTFAESRWFLTTLPLLVVAGTLAAVSIFGLWIVVSVYFYWQWFHYTRQSWGVSRAYRGKDRDALYEEGRLDQAIFYALPVLGILLRSHQDPGTFIGMELRVIPVPALAVDVATTAALLLLGVWTWRRVLAWRAGRLARLHTLYMLTHFAIFAIGYLAISDVTYGWLAINMWHNAQYILFVWLFNTKRFKDGPDPEARFLSYISQPQRLGVYLASCVAITGAVYWGALRTIDTVFFSGLAATVVIYQIVNFHHYIVDSKIWKLRTEALKMTLALKS